ncbi:MAG: winged helix-turn-helix domain-containing protein, partial [Dokdonia donghaensis]|nr:winged helix-turn-helix domain-containing protein [Dokdonia donghaensis]
FYENKNQLLRREDILSKIWGNDDFFSGRSMDVFISRLRKYFKDDSSISIASTRGVGLTFTIELSKNE